MADDLDVDSMAYMPNVNRLLTRAGVTFGRHTVSYSLCCPSRASYLGGQFSHNNNVRGNNAPTGGYGNLDADRTLPVWLSRAGYVTSHLGKYLNGYDGTQHAASAGVPPGYTEWSGLVDPLTYRYYGYLINQNGFNVVHGVTPGGYQTDTLTDMAVDFIERRAGTRPFFLDVAYVAPHGEMKPGSNIDAINPSDFEERLNDESWLESPPVPAPRHAGFFPNATAPRLPSFDEADVADKPGFVRARARFTPVYIEEIDRWYRARLRSLQAVDEGVARIVEALRETGELENTFILFTSDNGWEQGDHRLALKKVDVYEASTRIPLVIRGPDVPHGAVVRDWTSNVDVHPTILALAHAERPGATFPLDGMSLQRYLFEPRTTLGRVILHEAYEGTRAPYTAVRAGRWKYVEYASGERELYDLVADPYELRSLHTTSTTKRLRAELSALLSSLRPCSGASCVVTGYGDGWQLRRSARPSARTWRHATRSTSRSSTTTCTTSRSARRGRPECR
jgi:arylsulfatase A-like enzyme